MKNNTNLSIQGIFSNKNFIYTLSFLVFSLFFSNTISAQVTKRADITKTTPTSFTLKGTIYSNSDNAPLPGASILLKNSSIGVETDIDGNFELENIKEGTILNISFLGHEPKQIIAKNNKTPMKIYMNEDDFILAGAVDTKATYKTKRSFIQRIASIF